MKIRKLQRGSVISSLYVTHQPVDLTGGASTTPAQQAAPTRKNEGLSDKDLFNLISKLDVLPSDEQRILQNYRQLSRTQAISGNNSFAISNAYTNLLQSINSARHSKHEYDSALMHANSKERLNAYAINSRGQFFCSNGEGDFKLLTAEQLNKYKDKYLPLTNSEMLYYRAQDPSLANFNDMLSVVRDSVSSQDIADHIKDIASNIGKTEFATSDGTASNAISNTIAEYMSMVQTAAGRGYPNADLSALQRFGIANSNQVYQIQNALGYIYQMLSQPEKALLKCMSGEYNDEGAIKLVGQYLTATSNYSLKLINEKKTTTTSGSGGTSTSTWNVALAMATREGGNTDMLTIGYKTRGTEGQEEGSEGQEEGHSVGFTTRVISMSLPHPEGMGTVNDLINSQKNGFSLATNMATGADRTNGITFGNVHMDPTYLSLFVLPEDSAVVRFGYFPKNEEGQVNFKIVDAYSELLTKVRNRLNDKTADLTTLTKEQYANVKDIISESEFSNYLNDDGSMNPEKFGLFMVIPCITSDRMLQRNMRMGKATNIRRLLNNDVDPTDPLYRKRFVEHIHPKDTRYKPYGKRIKVYGDTQKFKFGKHPYTAEHIYYGQLYIPMQPNKLISAIAGGQLVNLAGAANVDNLSTGVYPSPSAPYNPGGEDPNAELGLNNWGF